MGIYKRGRVWWISFTCQGKYYRKSTETEDRKLAQRILDRDKGFTLSRLASYFWNKAKPKRYDALTIKALMGHKTLLMTSRYVHHNVESLRGAVEKLDDSFTNLSHLEKANL